MVALKSLETSVVKWLSALWVHEESRRSLALLCFKHYGLCEQLVLDVNTYIISLQNHSLHSGIQRLFADPRRVSDLSNQIRQESWTVLPAK